MLNVVYLKNAILIDVNLLESLDANVRAELVHRANNTTDKLVEVDFIVAIYVKDLEESRDVLLVNLDTKIVDRLSELVLIKGARVVVVHYFELSLETDEAARASSLQGRFEALE